MGGILIEVVLQRTLQGCTREEETFPPVFSAAASHMHSVQLLKSIRVIMLDMYLNGELAKKETTTLFT